MMVDKVDVAFHFMRGGCSSVDVRGQFILEPPIVSGAFEIVFVESTGPLLFLVVNVVGGDVAGGSLGKCGQEFGIARCAADIVFQVFSRITFVVPANAVVVVVD